MPGRIVIRASSGQFYFALWAANAEKILQSEMYGSKASAQTGAQGVKPNASLEHRYERRTSTSNQPYFILKGANGEIIGTSEMYSSLQARDDGIASCKANGPTAVIMDQT